MTSLLALLLSVSVGSAAPARRRPAAEWKPVSFVKVMLGKRSREGIVFTKNSDGTNVAYSAAYLVGGKVLRERTIPADIFTTFQNSLSRDVLAHARTGDPSGCTNEIAVVRGTMVTRAGRTVVGADKVTPVCLNAGPYGRANEESFKAWYTSGRAIFGL